MRCIGLFSLLIAFIGPPASGAPGCKPPAWSLAKHVEKSGSHLELICKGRGATNEIAEIEASSDCDARASGEFRPSIDVNDIVVTDESSTALLRTVAQRSCVLGLQCESLQIFTCEDKGTSYAWRQCSYDLSKARFGSANECQARTMPDSTAPEDSIKNRKSLDIIHKKVQVKDAGKHQRGDRFVVSISSTPPCESILIKGRFGRQILCTQNPMPVPVGSEDEALVVRATGYVPKEILVRGKSKESHVDVYLDESD